MPSRVAEALVAWLEASPFEISADRQSLASLPFLDAAHLRARELRSAHPLGARVVVGAGRGLSYWIDLVGVWLAGCVPVPIPARPCPALEAAVAEAVSRPGLGEAAVWFTSGSTGTPKGVRLSAEGLLGNVESSARRLALPAGGRLLVPVPFSFVSSLSHFLVAVRTGASFLGYEGPFFPGDFLKEAERVAADCLGGAPIHLRWVLESKGSWNWLMASGDRLSPATAQALLALFPSARLNVVYGMTELSGRAFLRSSAEGTGGEDTVGTALEGIQVRLDRETQEVQFSGPFAMLGYEGRGREGFTDDGWLRSGDLGEWDFQGRLRLLGRTDDLFKCAGNKVSAVLLADALMKTGDFEDVAVVPHEHPLFGHIPHAYVVPSAPGWEAADTLAKLRTSLAPDQLPHGFTRVAQIPRTGSGKVKRQELGRPAI